MRGLLWSLLVFGVLTSSLCSVLIVVGWTPSLTPQRTPRMVKEPTTIYHRSSSLLLATVAEDIQFDPIAELKTPDDSTNEKENSIDDDDEDISMSSLLSYTFDELSNVLGGTGKAKACWDCLRMGIDPIWYHSGSAANEEHHEGPTTNSNKENAGALLQGWSRQQVEERLAATSTKGTVSTLGKKALRLMEHVGGDRVEEDIAKLSQISISPDGTTKLLLQLVSDGLEVETVIIPWDDRGKSTLCVSSQVGCRQGCTFCSTGRMGKLRSLTTAEILAQMYWANKIQRLLPEQEEDINNFKNLIKVYPIDNCVFMGMGEPADNIPAVVKAATMMTDANLFQLAPRRITISTVAPNPDVFQKLAEAPVVLAWSVHSSRDDIRRQLVPTTRHSMVELRDGLITTLRGRSKRLRNTMLEVTLLDEINDSPEHAQHLADFCKPFFEGPDAVKGIKLTVNLIPWNDISASFGPASGYRQPKEERIRAYQKVLGENGILCYVRTTRGDEENAACGMLSTKKRKKDMEAAAASATSTSIDTAIASSE